MLSEFNWQIFQWPHWRRGHHRWKELSCQRWRRDWQEGKKGNPTSSQETTCKPSAWNQWVPALPYREMDEGRAAEQDQEQERVGKKRPWATLLVYMVFRGWCVESLAAVQSEAWTRLTRIHEILRNDKNALDIISSLYSCICLHISYCSLYIIDRNISSYEQIGHTCYEGSCSPGASMGGSSLTLKTSGQSTDRSSSWSTGRSAHFPSLRAIWTASTCLH